MRFYQATRTGAYFSGTKKRAPQSARPVVDLGDVRSAARGVLRRRIDLDVTHPMRAQ